MLATGKAEIGPVQRMRGLDRIVSRIPIRRDGRVERVGGDGAGEVDFRLVWATNRDLRALVAWSPGNRPFSERTAHHPAAASVSHILRRNVRSRVRLNERVSSLG